MPKQPLVSIIIPTYNRAHLIGETLDSVLAQTYTNWECIVVDDGSTDGTSELMKEYCDKDARFQYHHRPADRLPGGNAARNYGFEVSRGEYIKWFDSDDVMYVNFINTQVSILEDNKLLDFCACPWEYFNGDNAIKKNHINLHPKNHPLYSYFLEGHVFATPSPLWQRKFLKGKELFDIELVRGQEADFHFRMLTQSPNYLLHEDFLFKVRREHFSIESNSNNYEAQKSVLLYYNKAFYKIKECELPRKFELLQYLIYRNLIQLYGLLNREKSLIKRLKYLRYKNDIIAFKTYLPTLKFIRVFFGFILMVFFEKGYSLININEYDYRKSN